jgi:flagellar M-ring protein FliF
MPASPLSQLRALNAKLTLNQKLSILALGGVMLFGLLFFAYLVQREPYQLLLSDLDAASANTVVERLRSMDVPYRLADGGKSILVPADRVDELRIDVVSQGLPSKGRMGFELFDQGQWGITDFAEKVNYRRALEGELERTILSLAEVQQARVHLVLGRKSLFEEDEEPAKASVVIRLRDGATLNKQRVRGIGNLVAFAVEGLAPENVTVVDVNGNLLSESLAEDRRLSVAQLDLRSKVERELCEKVVSILEPVVGADNVKVTASVQLDYSETTEKTQQVADPIMISRQLTEEIVNDSGKQGIPFKANAPENQQAAAQATAQPGRSLQSETTNYEVSKTFRERVLPSGSLLRQSVAVVVNDRLVPASAPADGEPAPPPQYAPRTPEEMERIRALVAATIGLNPDRGDALTVENVSFSGRRDGVPFTGAEPGFWDRYKHIIYPVSRYLLVLLVFGLFYLMIFRPVKKRVFAYVDVERNDLQQLAATLNDPELLKQLEAAAGGQDKALLPPKVTDRNQALKKDLLTIAKENPQAMTQLIRSWLSEGV